MKVPAIQTSVMIVYFSLLVVAWAFVVYGNQPLTHDAPRSFDASASARAADSHALELAASTSTAGEAGNGTAADADPGGLTNGADLGGSSGIGGSQSGSAGDMVVYVISRGR